MARSYLPTLLLLSAIWGASYLFIKVAVDDLEPTVMMLLRCWIAVPPLLLFVAWRSSLGSALRQIADAWRPALVLGAINAALPFFLIAWGEKYIDSSVAAIAQASVPLFNVLLAWRFLPSERASGLRLAGVLLGLAGVGVLTGVSPAGGWWAVAGTVALIVASLSYAAGGLYGQVHVANVAGPVLATASMFVGGLLLLPFALVQLPSQAPGWDAIGSVLALSLAGTAFAQLILFRMLRLYGSQRFSLVTYLMPLFALAYGALILEEEITPGALGGLVLILAGVALGSGVLRPRREAAVTHAP